MPSNRCTRIYGFTLLEVMVALAVISIALLAVFRLHAQTLSMNNRAKFNVTAPLLAQLKLSEIEAESFALIDDAGNFGDAFSGYTWNTSINHNETEYLGQLSDKLIKIDLVISFNHDEFIYRLRTYRFISE